jgi:hypothetical protein
VLRYLTLAIVMAAVTVQGFSIDADASSPIGPAPSAAASLATREHVQHAALGSLRAEYRYTGTPTLASHARIRIRRAGRLVVDRSAGSLGPGYARSGAARALSIRQLDGTGPPEVLLQLYSGGAHCCWETWIFTGAHRARQSWGHAMPVLRDADGDGKPEFHGPDTRFAYAFGSFASSRFPAAVWSYGGGSTHDVTSAFVTEVQADQAAQYASYVDGRDTKSAELVRSSLAAYAADGYRLGQGDATMAVVQAAVAAGEVDTDEHDPSSFWRPDYVGLLRDLLHRLGYA